MKKSETNNVSDMVAEQMTIHELKRVTLLKVRDLLFWARRTDQVVRDAQSTGLKIESFYLIIARLRGMIEEVRDRKNSIERCFMYWKSNDDMKDELKDVEDTLWNARWLIDLLLDIKAGYVSGVEASPTENSDPPRIENTASEVLSSPTDEENFLELMDVDELVLNHEAEKPADVGNSTLLETVEERMNEEMTKVPDFMYPRSSTSKVYSAELEIDKGTDSGLPGCDNSPELGPATYVILTENSEDDSDCDDSSDFDFECKAKVAKLATDQVVGGPDGSADGQPGRFFLQETAWTDAAQIDDANGLGDMPMKTYEDIGNLRDGTMSSVGMNTHQEVLGILFQERGPSVAGAWDPGGCTSARQECRRFGD